MCLLPLRRSHKNIYAQVIDDSKGHVLVSASTKEKGLEVTNGGNCDGALEVGKRLGARALEKGVRMLVRAWRRWTHHRLRCPKCT